MSMIDRIMYAIAATPEQEAAYRAASLGDERHLKMVEIMRSNGLSQMDMIERMSGCGGLAGVFRQPSP